MNVLYIDADSFPAHINYNKLQIDALNNVADSISFCFRKGYYDSLQYSDEKTSTLTEIPDLLYKKFSNGFLNRIMMFLRYWFVIIKLNFKLLKFDHIILSYYDEIPLFFSVFPKGTFLINHINLYGINKSKTKRIFFKLISKRYNQIVLDQNSLDYVKSIGISNVWKVNHGIIPPYNTFESPTEIDKFIFCPSSNSSDHKFIESLINDEKFYSFLVEHGYRLIVKGKYSCAENKLISVIDYFLTEKEYRDLFIHSKFILLPYKSNFMYRTSGVLLEGIANHKIILVNHIPSLLQYKNYYDDIYSFSDSNNLINLLQKLTIEDKKSLKKIPIIDLKPDYSFLKVN